MYISMDQYEEKNYTADMAEQLKDRMHRSSRKYYEFQDIDVV